MIGSQNLYISRPPFSGGFIEEQPYLVEPHTSGYPQDLWERNHRLVEAYTSVGHISGARLNVLANVDGLSRASTAIGGVGISTKQNVLAFFPQPRFAGSSDDGVRISTKQSVLAKFDASKKVGFSAIGEVGVTTKATLFSGNPLRHLKRLDGLLSRRNARRFSMQKGFGRSKKRFGRVGVS